MDRCQRFARRYRYVLKADVRKYFPSIDHGILKGLLARKVKDPHVLWLVNLIIDHSNPQVPALMWFPGDDLFTPMERRRGLPLGNQTSQFFANVYLDPLDHFVTDRLGLSYVRYVNDFLVFADDKRRLHEVKSDIEHVLESLRLQIHRDKSVVFPCEQGIRFLGYRVFPTHRLLAQENVRRFRRRLQRMRLEFAAGRIGFDAIRPRIMSWIGHAQHANTYRLRSDLFRRMSFQRAAANRSSASGRGVQQSTVERPLGQPQQERADEPQHEQRVPPRQYLARDDQCPAPPEFGCRPFLVNPGVCSQVQAAVPCRAASSCPGRTIPSPGGSSRSSDSKALPGFFRFCRKTTEYVTVTEVKTKWLESEDANANRPHP